MPNVENCLRDLLLAHDCVTLPGLGGFIMHTQTARIDRDKGRIFPPSRTASFNSMLAHDDGLLASYIARQGKMTYARASAHVARFVDESREKLSKGLPVMLDGVGELYEGYEGNLRFLPKHGASLSSEFYGLEPVSIKPAVKPVRAARTQAPRSDRKKSAAAAGQPASVKWTLAITLPVILFLLYGVLFPVSIRPVIANLSGIFSAAHALLLDETQPAFTGAENTPVIELPDVPTAEAASDEVSKEPESQTVNPVVVADQTVPAGPRYYIIGGCFEQAENAQKFIEQLLRQGYSAEEAGTNRLGQIRISYESFSDKEPALLFLEQIRNGVNSSAWLLKY